MAIGVPIALHAANICIIFVSNAFSIKNMEISELQQLLKNKNVELSGYFRRKLPVKAGAKVRSIIQENFRLGGFQNGALERWPDTKRQSTGRGADARRGPLLSSRKVLYNGTGYTPGNGSVTIYNNVVYAGIHNTGGETHPRVTPKMRRYAWARYYEEGGGQKKKGRSSGQADFWKGLALTKKKTLNIKIPKRQFMGPSKTIDAALQTMIATDLNTILNL